ncbi:hypothetical protein GKG47_11855 [Lactonifactor sp. BIOML-A3]|uniref:helix-turn-helix domain-containing protein n=1 Tax=unclassified Lactonifactor TaxID=2636670 RepID=UPI0012B0036B|nr:MULTISPECIES: helix-turn-helix domain-containing protein [unclassified Lactonifactor]MSA01046.1 hypothetical protein [Lactonifactor sp. BIOML-A5]MSA10308.1 hypothetical protein [Lactonifactor sp. BIOML-A4]MSA13118.1 hypothetical protein [Lactonifactor sp. BIOML-A3]MSA19280.1 hypothetical protein [Lactonifactor sp. BIOML-A2]MSA38357.1 hypothetical protein [Lactonifactor sp. BIOML-A1]
MILTREFFANYKYLGSMIKSMERRLRYFENHPLVSEHGVVNGSMKMFPYAACHFVVSGASVKSKEERETMIRQLMVDLEGNRILYEDMKLDIERFIFDNPGLTLEEQTIFRLKYIENWSLEKIGYELGYDKSVISRKIDAVLDKTGNNSNLGEIFSMLG